MIQVRGHDAAVSIGFSVPAPTSPASLGISDDTRLLGIALTRLRVGPWRLRDSLTSIGYNLLRAWSPPFSHALLGHD